MKLLLKISVLLAAFLLIAGCTSGALYEDQAPSEVTVNYPEDSPDVPVNGTFTATFSKAVNLSTVTGSSFFLAAIPSSNESLSNANISFDGSVCNPANAISATLACSSDITCTLTPSAALNPSTSYALCLTNAIFYADGNEFPGKSMTFTTVAGDTGTVATPAFSPAAGTYTSAQSVTISTATADAKIYYTTDGTTPTASSTEYTTPITVSSTTTIKAIGVKTGMTNSAVGSATYTIELTIATPTFDPAEGSYSSEKSVTIATETSGATIHYTTDGTTPTASSTEYTTPITVSSTTTIKAIAVKTGMTTSAVASAAYTITQTAATPTLSPGSGTYTTIQSIEISTTTSGATIYYTTDGSTPTEASSVYEGALSVTSSKTVKAIAAKDGFTTSGVGSADYIVNLETVATPSFSPAASTYDSEQSITISTTTAGATIHYTLDGSTPTTSSSQYLTPITISANTTLKAIAVKYGMLDSAVASGNYSIRAATPTFSPDTNTYNTAQSVTISTTTAGATVYYTTDGSTPTDASSTSQPVNITQTTTLKAIAVKSGLTNSEVGSAIYTLKAVAPELSPGTATYTTSQAVTMSTTTAGASIRYTDDGTDPTTGSDLYSEPVSITATKTIKAKAFKDNWSASDTSTVVYTIQAATPTFSPDTETYTTAQSVTISSATAGTTIYYTTNGDTPTTGSTEYTTPVSVSQTTTLKAIAVKTGLTDSEVGSAIYTLKAVAPELSPGTATYTTSQAVTMSTTTAGASIRYTDDGTDPTTGSDLYSEPVSITATKTIKAKAFKDNWTASDTSTVVYTIQAATPTFSPDTDTYTTAQSVTISSATAGTTIYYTTDGSTPTTGSTEYTTPVSVSQTTTLKAIAVKTGLTDSEVGSAIYTLKAVAPELSPGTATYTTSQAVTMSTTTAGASIRYTLDGSDPTIDSSLYSDPVSITATKTIKAKAFKDNWSASESSTVVYTIQAATPTFSPDTDTYTTAQSVTISSATAGTTIYYTTNGDTPTTGSTEYTTPVSVSQTTTLKAIAVKTGLTDSEVGTATYTLKAVAPELSPGTATYTTSQAVTMSTTTAGASIRYTDDGTDPTTGSDLYSEPVSITATKTIKAKAFKDNWSASDTSTVVYTIQAATPTFSPDTDTYTTAQSVTISSATAGTTIYYTTDGSTPTTGSTEYTTPVSVSQTTTLKAIAVKTGLTDSEVGSAIYTLKAVAPELSPGTATYTTSQAVTMSTTTAGAAIYYTLDGTDPTTGSDLYSEPVSITATKTIKAKAFKDNWSASDTSTVVYTIQAATPTFSPDTDTYTTAQSVTISTTTPDATIYYTTDGSTPTTGSSTSQPVNITQTTTLKAIAVKSGLTNSEVGTATYTLQVVTPALSPGTGTYSESDEFTMSTTTDGAAIYYTTDGTEPTESSTLYSAPITLAETKTIRAKAFKTNWTASAEATATYTIQAATPTFDPAEGTYTVTKSVTITTTTAGATIRYTTDGSEPTGSSTIYEGAINVTQTTPLKAIAIKTGLATSEVGSATYTIKVATPTFDPAANTYTETKNVTISTTTAGATIYYTTNGDDPTTGSTEYTTPIEVDATKTLKALAVKSGLSDSTIGSATYTIKVATPTFDPVAGTYTGTQNVTITTTTAGATIYYTTNGADPTTESTEYTTPVEITESKTLKALAVKTGLSDSSIGSAAYTIKVETPTFDPVAGTYTGTQNVTISSTTAGATIYYTTNGDDPTTGSTEYTTPIEVDATKTLKALAVKTGMTDSAIGSAAYTIKVVTPTFNPAAGTYTEIKNVTISTTTAGATIYYTTNGTDPTTGSTEYSTPIEVAESKTLKALAVKSGLTDSAIGSAEYTINLPTAATPTFSPTAGTYVGTQNVTISSTTDGAVIYYTTNGDTPTTGSTPYSAPVEVTEAKTLKAIATKTGYNNSEVGSATYAFQAATPTFDPVAGTYTETKNITISTSTSGASIYYTTNGADPTSGSTPYTTPVEIASTTTLKAIAIKGGLTDSGIGSATYTIKAATPTFSPVAGTYTEAKAITISTTTGSATIYYTTNGDDPTTGSSVYSTPIVVGATKTLKALAVKGGLTNSEIGSAVYTINISTGAVTAANTDSFYTNLSWTPIAEDVVTYIYAVYRSTSNNITTVEDAEANGTKVKDYTSDLDSYIANGLDQNTTYYFNVLAKDDSSDENKVAYTSTSATTKFGLGTNGAVNAIEVDATNIYLGGGFTAIGKNLPYGRLLDTTTGTTPSTNGAGQPVINGSVYAVVSDGSSGWYIGGNFSKVYGLTRNGLAHIDSFGNLDADWNPNAGSGGIVRSMALSGGVLYVGGNFTSIGGSTRNNIGAITASTGTVTSWDPNGNDSVSAIAVSGTNVYVGGRFTTIGGQSRNGLAALSTTTGSATSWDPNPFGGQLQAISISGDGNTLYVGGNFQKIGGESGTDRKGLAAFYATGENIGQLTTWNPASDIIVDVKTLAISGSTVYVGGEFTTIGANSASRNKIAAIDGDGNATAWDPNADSMVNAIIVNDTTVYAAGSFTTIGGASRNRIAAINSSTGAATSWDPNLDNTVNTIALSGTTVFAGGDFQLMSPITRNRIAAITASTGALADWNPNADMDVNTLVVSGTTLYVGGMFQNIGGAARNRIAAINTSTGAATAWNPNLDESVSAIAISGTTLYAGGSFTTIGGETPRANMVAISTETGTATAWAPNPNMPVFAIAVSDSIVYAGGIFTSIGKTPASRNYIAAIDADGEATAWDANAGSTVRALVVGADANIYAGGDFEGIGGEDRRRAATLSILDATVGDWDPYASSTVNAIKIVGSTVFLGGEFTTLNAEPATRNYIGVVNNTDGTVTSCDPNANLGVKAIDSSGDAGTVYIGGSFTTMGGNPRQGFAALDVATCALK